MFFAIPKWLGRASAFAALFFSVLVPEEVPAQETCVRLLPQHLNYIRRKSCLGGTTEYQSIEKLLAPFLDPGEPMPQEITFAELEALINSYVPNCATWEEIAWYNGDIKVTADTMVCTFFCFRALCLIRETANLHDYVSFADRLRELRQGQD